MYNGSDSNTNINIGRVVVPKSQLPLRIICGYASCASAASVYVCLGDFFYIVFGCLFNDVNPFTLSIRSSSKSSREQLRLWRVVRLQAVQHRAQCRDTYWYTSSYMLQLYRTVRGLCGEGLTARPVHETNESKVHTCQIW